MANTFRLAGVLRLRKLTEDRAKLRLAGAGAELDGALERAGGLAAYVESSPEGAGTSASLAALAASRAAAGAMYSVLESEVRLKAQTVDEARAALQQARSEAMGLEKLQERHDRAAALAEGRTEQAALDEVASSAWHRTSGRTAGP
ncbi:flagellar export protein FliJ [Isoptericola sp. NEAU-Y5]|uniref:Flagellar FliJ protein n=1 Tax=Isoptericola luteus TaxID=2879484 RepID=A0ABS7ZL94_9MICO|nr:flagellar export protein FliJ [Isoptericola sp. NEAU-Y5]MCA5895131.1 flagellar export protein FliJ [Isoptericola sp. NEAU-Y5]